VRGHVHLWHHTDAALRGVRHTAPRILDTVSHAALVGVATSLRGTESFTGGYRLDTRVAGGDQRYLHVRGDDGAVRTATAAGADGVTVGLTDGRQVAVTFDHDGAGANLTLDGTIHTLDATAQTLPIALTNRYLDLKATGIL
jgi:hypothetical protein